jgi:hypothetical protein
MGAWDFVQPYEVWMDKEVEAQYGSLRVTRELDDEMGSWGGATFTGMRYDEMEVDEFMVDGGVDLEADRALEGANGDIIPGR